MTLTPQERRYARAISILDGKANGFGVPILFHLALRGMSDAMIALSNELSGGGAIADPFSQRGLCRRAWRRGDTTGAQNLAVDCFNRHDLQGYRHWLHRAARMGNPYAAREVRRFETRLPHLNARKIGRKRPDRKYDFEILDC